MFANHSDRMIASRNDIHSSMEMRMRHNELACSSKSDRSGIYTAFVSGAKFGIVVSVLVLLVRNFL